MVWRVAAVAGAALAALGASSGDRTVGSATWMRLQAPPPLAREPAFVWTGRYAVAWGGYGPARLMNTGARYDARDDSWTRLRRAPIAGRTGAAAVWTGSHVLVWGGLGRRALGDGAELDPETGSWRGLPRAPLAPRAPAAWAWTGRELLIWGDASRAAAAPDGAAYDPRTRRWRRLPPAPFALNEASAAWVGGEMLVLGARLDERNASKTEYARGLAYDPVRNRWRVLPRLPLSPQASSIVSVGSQAVAWDYLLAAGMYNPSTNRWARLPRLPLDQAECYPASATVASHVLAWYCGSGAVLDTNLRWRRLRPPHGVILGAPLAAGARALFLSWRGGLWAYTPA